LFSAIDLLYNLNLHPRNKLKIICSVSRPDNFTGEGYGEEVVDEEEGEAIIDVVIRLQRVINLMDYLDEGTKCDTPQTVILVLDLNNAYQLVLLLKVIFMGH
jgi:hypothetical protein